MLEPNAGNIDHLGPTIREVFKLEFPLIALRGATAILIWAFPKGSPVTSWRATYRATIRIGLIGYIGVGKICTFIQQLEITETPSNKQFTKEPSRVQEQVQACKIVMAILAFFK